MSPKDIAQLIATGHAYQKHVVERKEFPEIESIQDFIELIQQVIVSGQKKVLFGDRIAYWSSFQRTVVI